MSYEIIQVTVGHGGEHILGRLRDDAELDAQMWADAETHVAELLAPGLLLWVAVDDRYNPGAWAAARVEAGAVTCCCNYVRHGHRAGDVGVDLYEMAYRARHQALARHYARRRWQTWIFAQPLARHLADGWQVRQRGMSAQGHEWWGLVRDPD